jgi:uncharacterized protein YndB with AHSA1/START domain
MTSQPAPIDQPENGSGERVIDLSVEVVGTPEQVWEAIATGPGISSWYVPTTIEEQPGGATTSRFGEGPEMLIPGRVVAWEPPLRVLFAGTDENLPSLAFEWLVEARDRGTCVVRLVNSGFSAGTPWENQYEGLAEGWRLFMYNLKLHLEHFAGQRATAMMPTAVWRGDQGGHWSRLTGALGIPAALQPGERVVVTAKDAPELAGTVDRAEPGQAWLIVDSPAPGTALLACERDGVSIWQYLYGDHAAAIVERDTPRWNSWLAAHTEE